MRLMTCLCSVLLLVIVCALALPAGAASLTPEEVPVLVVPRLTTPPKIDGTIDPAQWREAAAISGVANQGDNIMIPRPTTYYVGWDPGHFYLAFRTYLRPGYKPAIYDGRSPGQASVIDDTAEFVIKPGGKNVPINNQQAAFKFFLNCIGFIGDQSKLDLGQQLKNGRRTSKPPPAAPRRAPLRTADRGARWK